MSKQLKQQHKQHDENELIYTQNAHISSCIKNELGLATTQHCVTWGL